MDGWAWTCLNIYNQSCEPPMKSFGRRGLATHSWCPPRSDLLEFGRACLIAGLVYSTWQ